MPYSDLPEPKFAVGQTVWRAGISYRDEQLPCPDCLDTRKWIVTTPAGQTYEAKCQRCQGGLVYTHADSIPSLRYRVAVPNPTSLEIVSVEVRSKGTWAKPEITYWGPGNGSAEDAVYGSREEALAVSEIMAAKQNDEERAKPEFLEQKNIGDLKFEDAHLDRFKNGLWHAWYAYNDVIEKLDSHLEGKETLTEGDVSWLRTDFRYAAEYRAKDDRPLDKLVDAVRAALAGDLSLLPAAYAALPEALTKLPQQEAAPDVD